MSNKSHSAEEIDDELTMELIASMVAEMSPYCHLIETLVHIFSLMNPEDYKGVANYCTNPNINPKDSLNPSLAFLFSTPLWQTVAPEVKAKLDQSGVSHRANQRLNQRSTYSLRSQMQCRPRWA